MELAVADTPKRKGRKAEWFPGRTVAERNAMVEAHARLVPAIVKSFVESRRRRGHAIPDCDMGDLRQEGYVGLMWAARKYDPAKEVKFSTYAYRWIRGRLLCFYERKWGEITVPGSVPDDIQFYLKTEQDMESGGNARPTPSEVADAIGGRADRKERLRDIGHLIHKEWLSADDKRGGPHETADPRSLPAEADPAIERLRSALRAIEPRSAKILALRFGLDGYGSRTYSECGAEVGLSEGRAAQITLAAIKSLRSRLASTREAA